MRASAVKLPIQKALECEFQLHGIAIFAKLFNGELSSATVDSWAH
jgi:hypothetical protein